MSDETAPFAEWLDEFKGFLRDSNQKGYLYRPKIVPKRYRKTKVKWRKFVPKKIQMKLAHVRVK